jgi:glycosyltransferase involved in cell wall biosynthesis
MKYKILFIFNNLGVCGNERLMVRYINNIYELYDIHILNLGKKNIIKSLLPNNVHYHDTNSIELLNTDFDIEIATSEFYPSKYLYENHKNNSKRILMMSTILWDKEPEKIKNYIDFYNKIIFVSNFQLEIFKQLFPDYNLNKCYIIKNTLNYNEIIDKSKEEIKWHKKGFTIGIVGRLSKEKNVIEALDILRYIKNYNIRLLYIGDGNYKNDIIKIAKRHRINDRVEIIPYQINPYPYMEKCDIILSTSISESFGLTLLEGIFLNKMIVSKSQGAKNEVLKNGELGFIYNDFITASKFIETYFYNRDNEIHNNISKYLKEYDDKKMIKDFIDIIKGVN